MFQKVKPYAAMVFQQFSFAVMSIIFLAIVKDGMSQSVLFVYRNAVAAIFIAPFALYFERVKRPMMTKLIFLKIMGLALFQTVLEQNLYFMGTKLTSATYGAALKNLIPSITFFLSLALRVEKLNIHQVTGKAKVIGALLTLTGTLLLVLYEGPVEEFPWSKGPERYNTTENSNGNGSLRRIKGTLMILASSTSWSIFLILQSNTLKSYGANLHLTTFICSLGAVMNIVLALVMEHGRPQFFIISWDMKLFAIIYSGVVCTGITNYLLEMVLKDKGPVFAGAFSPFCMIITAIMGSFILAEKIHLGT
ncbi:WAT1-related protein [Dendrobium catenatum]|uniref:WAT1-related protein n=1 Tax=Dendrobium catenatum TaxID=906689 RepID=A0A2I0W545_9ASPA|nr:WAT1-related protein [Dendrobium catenatum]